MLVLCTTLSGCFGIEEKVLIHKDGSGQFTYTMDMTKMMTRMMEMIQKLGKAFDSDSTDTKAQKELQNDEARDETMQKMKKDMPLKQSIDALNSLKGISACHEFTDTTNGKMIMGLTFKFANVGALNKALKTMLTKKKGGKKNESFPPATYAFKDGILTRELSKAAVTDLMGNDGKEEAFARALMKDFKYIIVVESDSDIKSAAAAGAKVLFTGNKATIDYDLLNKDKEIIAAKMRSEVKVY